MFPCEGGCGANVPHKDEYCEECALKVMEGHSQIILIAERAVQQLRKGSPVHLKEPDKVPAEI
jgi:hypothetical protein